MLSGPGDLLTLSDFKALVISFMVIVMFVKKFVTSVLKSGIGISLLSLVTTLYNQIVNNRSYFKVAAR